MSLQIPLLNQLLLFDRSEFKHPETIAYDPGFKILVDGGKLNELITNIEKITSLLEIDKKFEGEHPTRAAIMWRYEGLKKIEKSVKAISQSFTELNTIRKSDPRIKYAMAMIYIACIVAVVVGAFMLGGWKGAALAGGFYLKGSLINFCLDMRKCYQNHQFQKTWDVRRENPGAMSIFLRVLAGPFELPITLASHKQNEIEILQTNLCNCIKEQHTNYPIVYEYFKDNDNLIHGEILKLNLHDRRPQEEGTSALQKVREVLGLE